MGSHFPNPREAGPEGIVALGGPFTTEVLVDAYSHGIFPWPIEGYPLTWFCPEERGILFVEDFHVSRRTSQYFASQGFASTIDQSFEEVIEACAQVPRKEGEGTWITHDLKAAYINLFKDGYAHSIETRNSKGELVGGVYGVEVRGIFSAESMFYFESNASQFALQTLVERVKGRGGKFVDIQMVTEHMSKMGGRSVPRDEYLDLLNKSQSDDRKFF